MATSGYPLAHALIIGVSKYQHVRPLPDVILNDARAVSATLSAPQLCGYHASNIVTLLDEQATRPAVLSALADLAARTDPDGTACVYFSGHGGLRSGASDSWLLTVECDPADLANTSVSATELSNALRVIRARRLLVFIDACHAGGAGTLKGDALDDEFDFGYLDKSLDSLAVGTGRVLIASSRVTEKSYVMHGEKNSAFTKALVAGLEGAADPSHTGLIKVFSLFEYLSEAVPRATGDKQHPIFKTTDFENNFPVALSRGGSKGLGATESAALSRPQTDKWATLERVLVELYPSGPYDQQIWSRAGGDLSRLHQQSSGVAGWHAALRMLKQGGGGNISFESLVDAVLEDYSANEALLALR